jgi:hypothetical protein
MEFTSTSNLFHFFYERVRAARLVQGSEVGEKTEFYLVNLLVEFQETRRLVESGGRRVDDRPLAIRLLESKAASPWERFRELKHLADSTLYVLGLFAPSLRKGTVDLKYYAGLGESAYDDLARITGQRSGEKRDPIFGELSDKFGDCVEILTDVRGEEPGGASGAATKDSEILSLYEHWLEFGSERAERRLRELGILPVAPGRAGTSAGGGVGGGGAGGGGTVH